MIDPREVLEAAQTILLVDWPHPGVPRALLDAGFTVFGFSPGGYSAVELVATRPDDVDAGSIYPPKGDDETGYLFFRKLDGLPARVDLVNAYRPPAEVPGIVTNQAVPLGAHALWLQPPNTSDEARRIAEEHGLAYVEGIDIAEVARAVRQARR
jgi:predicted CoA-binding protein